MKKLQLKYFKVSSSYYDEDLKRTVWEDVPGLYITKETKDIVDKAVSFDDIWLRADYAHIIQYWFHYGESPYSPERFYHDFLLRYVSRYIIKYYIKWEDGGYIEPSQNLVQINDLYEKEYILHIDLKEVKLPPLEEIIKRVNRSILAKGDYLKPRKDYIKLYKENLPLD